jgi:integrase/recombinase XerD
VSAPVITIFVRHSPGCKYAGDEFCKRCNCRKHFRWTQGGKQFRRTAGTRSWAEAEDNKAQLADQLAGRQPARATGQLLIEAIKTFDANKEAQGVKPRVRSMYARELKRLREFSERHGLITVAQALTMENLIALRSTWNVVYPSSSSRAVVQKHLNNFLRFCYDAKWIDRIPRLSPIKIDSPETLPLTATEYAKILKAATGKTRVLIQLMRWSGLAVRDASTLKRSDMHEENGVHKIIRSRTKTGTPLYIPIPAHVAAEVLGVANGNPVFVFWNRQKGSSSEYRQAGYMGEQIAKAFDEAGVQSEGHMISHRLRATFAVDLLQKGLPLEHVSKLLGHKSVTTTERHYAKWVKGRQDRLDSLVSATWKK